MPLDNETRNALFASLETRGWFWEGDYIFAPNRTMWLLGSEPWQSDLTDFHERMIARMQKLLTSGTYQQDKEQYQAACKDLASLIDSLKALLK